MRRASIAACETGTGRNKAAGLTIIRQPRLIIFVYSWVSFSLCFYSFFKNPCWNAPGN